MVPLSWCSNRWIARWVLPVLVGPSTAVSGATALSCRGSLSSGRPWASDTGGLVDRMGGTYRDGRISACQPVSAVARQGSRQQRNPVE